MKQRISALSRMLSRLAVFMMLVVLTVLPAEATDWDGVFRTIADGMKQEAQIIDISKYKIPYSQKSELNQKYIEYADKGWFPWYARDIGKNIYIFWHEDNIITDIEPAYLDRTQYNRNVYEAKVKEILDECVDDGMSQWQIALSLHDYIVTHCEYDYTFYTDRDNANYYGYDCLVNNLAVCEGYARAYLDLLKRVGIPAVRVLSRSMDHTWNLIQLDGKWYHVDATWDDPGFNEKDIEGYCGHNYFLMSDAAMQDSNHNHYGWVKYYSCTDTRYEKGVFWNEVNSSIVLPETEFSFLSRSDYNTTRIYLRDSYTANETLIFQSKNPAASNNRLYPSQGVSYDNGYVYCCDSKNVYAVTPDGKSSYVVYTNTATNKVIAGCYVDNGILDLTTRDFNNNFQTQRLNISLPNNHKHTYRETQIAPTCKYQGYNRYNCSCGSVFTAGYLDANGVHVPQGGYTVPVEPDFGVTGEKRFVCRDCGSQITQQLADLNTMTGTFGDVARDAFYYEPVLWAASRGVTTGTAAGVFSPDNTCTRGQVVTFLWRAMGEPEPVSSFNPFRDVDADAYYYKAILWAVENGITKGMSVNTFDPNGSCTRGQVVTFLNRTAGNPDAASDYCQFVDVEREAYYYDSVLWAVEEAITNGTATNTFEPGKTCTRGQIVTFLHRYLNG